jgi:predicted cation transporter
MEPGETELTLYATIGLGLVALAVLLVPILFEKIEEYVELFFLAMGILAVTISGAWHWEVVAAALAAPVIISNVPIGIFQSVLIVGFLMCRYGQRFDEFIQGLVTRISPRWFVFSLILFAGLLSGIFSVILMAIILAEILAVLPVSRRDQLKIVVVACFAAGMGGALTPYAQPLTTIMVHKLAGPPYNADFFFPLRTLGIYIIPSIIILAIFGALIISSNRWRNNGETEEVPEETAPRGAGEHSHKENNRGVLIRSLKVYVLVAALYLLGEGFSIFIEWYTENLSPTVLYWLNIGLAFLDRDILTEINIVPELGLAQVIGDMMGLLIAGGMLVQGHIPNHISAARLHICMKDWADLGVPIGIVLIAIFNLVLHLAYGLVY